MLIIRLISVIMACFIVLSIPLVASAESQLSVMPVSSQK